MIHLQAWTIMTFPLYTTVVVHLKNWVISMVHHAQSFTQMLILLTISNFPTSKLKSCALTSIIVFKTLDSEAILDFSAVLALDPDFASAAYARGVCLPG